ncbi:MAG: sulfatase-like hydrolase/transferase [Planctomycetota bacterium]|nr:sulfatase-like hydrolase/transferase [Planctomycetota bacterium]
MTRSSVVMSEPVQSGAPEALAAGIWGAWWFKLIRLALAAAAGYALLNWLDSRVLYDLANDSKSEREAFWRLALYWATGAWVLLLLLARRWWLRWPVAILVAATVATDQFYIRYINGDGFTPDEIFLALTNPTTLSDSLAVYWELSWPVVAISFGAAIAAAAFLPRLVVRVPARLAAAGGLVLIPLVMLLAREGYGYAGHAAAPVRLAACTAYYWLHPMIPPRDAPVLPPPAAATVGKPAVDHVIVIVDESVMGSHLGVNGYVRETSPRLRELIARGQALSLGMCSSATNYSIGSFLTVLSGVGPEQLKADFNQCLTRPSIIAYAAQAGCSMQFLNSQDFLVWIAREMEALGPRLRTASADRNRLPTWEWDRSLVAEAVRFIASHDRTLTIIAKRGIHYPYHDKCPPELRRFAPCLQQATWSERFIENVNSYDNAMAWTCDTYLADLRDALEKAGRNALIIYTSDHGQILPGEPIPGFEFKRTHAMLDSPTTSVVDVPLLLLATTPAQHLLADLPTGNVGLACHYDIFPTVLWLLGYDPSAIEAAYGPGLWKPIDPLRQRTFCEGKRIQKWRPFFPPDNSRKFSIVRDADRAGR